ncbi:Hypothetical predicted protein [Octopus vulgaris]|uniref:Uncharacterized protein n=1 Tax=Octopus vulgaris TaxID=6645 RepID=A0AA36B7H9_OCTVU|nr:Hypothetical predicted protein [Octopus vulgaris]
MDRACHSNSFKLPCLVMYGELEDGKHLVGGQQRFKDRLKATLKKCHIPLDSLESMPADRTCWHDASKTGPTEVQEDLHQSEVARCARQDVQNPRSTDVSVSPESNVLVIRGQMPFEKSTHRFAIFTKEERKKE